VKERAIENYIEVCKVVYKDNPLRASYILSDLSMATLNTEFSDFANYNYKVYITNTLQDTADLNQFKAYIQPIIQSSEGDLRIMSEVLTAQTTTEVKNIINLVQEQKEARDAARQKAEQEQMDKQLQAQMQDKQEQRLFEKQLADDKNATTLKAAELNAERFARANDINEDGENDLIELQLLKNQSKAGIALSEEKTKQVELQNKKLEKEIYLLGKTPPKK
jgi:hypothetical protein